MVTYQDSSVDGTPDTITGENFDNGKRHGKRREEPPVVLLGNQGSLEILSLSETGTEIIAKCPNGRCEDRDYLLYVISGRKQRQYDEYDLTIGAIGPQGPQGPAGADGVQGIQGSKGDKGNKGDAPAHQWSGTALSFQNPDGLTWGISMDLKGKPGPKGDTGPLGPEGPANPQIEGNAEAIEALKAEIASLRIQIRREFKLIGTAAYDSIVNSLTTGIAALNMQEDDYLYIKGTNKYGASELCTNDINARKAIIKFAKGEDYEYWGGYE